VTGGSTVVGQLTGRVAVVTGSASGIGEAIARRFAAEGAAVVVNSVRSVGAGERLAAELPEAVYVQADLADPAGADALVAAAVNRWGRLDVLVNNAGISPRLPHPQLAALSDEMWDEVLRVNLIGPWHLIRAAEPHLRAAGGAVVNVTSVAGLRATENGTSIPYHLSKSGLNHLTVLMANVLGPDVRVNAVAPGGIETPMWPQPADELRASVSARTVLGRPGRPDEVADACLFLARAGYVTGQVLAVDGGLTVKVQRDVTG
jgi:ketoreductase RED2